MTDYETFKNVIYEVLQNADGPLTWTEIRDSAEACHKKFLTISGCIEWSKT